MNLTYISVVLIVIFFQKSFARREGQHVADSILQQASAIENFPSASRREESIDTDDIVRPSKQIIYSSSARSGESDEDPEEYSTGEPYGDDRGNSDNFFAEDF